MGLGGPHAGVDWKAKGRHLSLVQQDCEYVLLVPGLMSYRVARAAVPARDESGVRPRYL